MPGIGKTSRATPATLQLTWAMKGHGIRIYRPHHNLRYEKVQGLTSELLKVRLGNRVLGLARAGDEGIFYGLVRQGKLIGVGMENRGLRSNWKFSKDGKLEVIKKVDTLLPQGKFRVIFVDDSAGQPGICMGDRIAGIVLLK